MIYSIADLMLPELPRFTILVAGDLAVLLVTRTL
jgi:hypothetical protein